MQRTELLDEKDVVYKSMNKRVKCFVGYILASLPTGERDELLANEYFHRRNYDGLERQSEPGIRNEFRYGASSILVSTESGFIFRSLKSLKKKEVSRVNFISSRNLNLKWNKLIGEARGNGIISTVFKGAVDSDDPLAARMASLRLLDIRKHNGEIRSKKIIPQFLVSKAGAREVLDRSYVYEQLEGDWVILGIGGVKGEPRSELMEMANTVRSSGDENVMISEWCIDQLEGNNVSDTIDIRGNIDYSIINQIGPIPFKSRKRKKVISNIDKEIKEFVLYWRNIMNDNSIIKKRI